MGAGLSVRQDFPGAGMVVTHGYWGLATVLGMALR